MARRRQNRELDTALGLAQLVGACMLLGLISPQGRQLISGISIIVICLFGIVVVGLIGFGFYRFATRSEQPQEVAERNVDWKALEVEVKRAPKLPQPTADLIEQLRAIDWFQFEKLVELVYRKLGYAVTRRGGANPDGGIDLVLEKEGQRSAVQCKQWKTWNVGVKPVREFLGALTDAGISTGIFITLRGYSGDAKRLADKHGIEIVNETGLARLLESTDVQFDPETHSLLNDKRKFCPKCENEMVIRTAKSGSGYRFWGCSSFPRCRFKLPF